MLVLFSNVHNFALQIAMQCILLPGMNTLRCITLKYVEILRLVWTKNQSRYSLIKLCNSGITWLSCYKAVNFSQLN
jgi:hypothetical protein